MINAWRIFRLDLRIHGSYFAAGVLVVAALALFRRSSSPLAVPAIVALIAAPVTVPFWTLGNDRVRGTLTFLSTLPVPKWHIPLGKAVGVTVLSLSYGFVAALVVALLGVSVATLAHAALVVAPASIGVSLVTTGIFLVVPARLGSYVCMALISLSAWLIFRFGPYVSAFPAQVLASVLFSIVGAVVLAITTAIWAARPSPND